MTIPVNTAPANTVPHDHSAADIYTDFAGLTALRKSAHNDDPAALRQVAKQYESLFARIMIKSMREAVGKDPLFGSDEQQTYQEMGDDQLSIELCKGKGLGLADLLVRQMQQLTSSTAPNGGPTAASSSGQPLPADARAMLRLFQDNAAAPYHSASVPAASPEARNNFISNLWPAAQRAGEQLGVDPRNLIAQAALETNWGTRVPHDTSGHSSNNLFGMKTGRQWSGSSVAAATQEYENGTPTATTGQFRAYDSREQSVQDYVSLLRSNPRYTGALNTGNNIRAFATALQHGGYATDPDYANKITAIAETIQPPAETSEPSLKSASAPPLTPNVEIL